MAGAHVGELPPGTKPCKICREPINSEARKCIHCQSSQSFLSGLAVSATMMSLLVALVSVLSAAVPAMRSLLTPVNSDLVFVPQGVTAQTVSVLVSNRGIRPGSLRSGAVELDNGALLQLHICDLPKNEPRIIDAGKTELVRMYSSAQLESPADAKECLLGIINTDFRGVDRRDTVKLHCGNVLPFLSAHGPGQQASAGCASAKN
jgi:hypothetical protein